MRKPNWDTESGREMWLDGKKDAEIADAFGISVYAVTNYRVKHWQKAPEQKNDAGRKSSFSLRQQVTAGEGVDPAILDKIRVNAEKAGINLPGAAATGSPLAGMKAFDFERGLKPPTGEPEAEPAPFAQGSLGGAVPVASHDDSAAEDLTAEEKDSAKAPVAVVEEQPNLPSRDALDAIADAMKALQDLAKEQGVEPVREIATPPVAARNDSDKDASYSVAKPRLDEMDVMAAATEHLSGMQAVCTACAIQALWFWTGPADLRRAKKNIDWLLDHLEG